MKTRPLALLVLPLVGCGSRTSGYTPTPPPKVEAASLDLKRVDDLMPTEVGNAWDYHFKASVLQKGRPIDGGDGTLTYRVDSRRGDGATLLLLERDGLVQDRQLWRAAPDGLYQLSGGVQNIASTPPQLIAPFPLKQGAKFRWSGKAMMANGKLASGESTSEVGAPQTVDTEMSGADASMSAIPITSKTTFRGGKSENTWWFRPGVGLVRYLQKTTTADGRETTVLLRLAGYSKKK